MQNRPFQDQDKQPEGHGLCLIIVIIIVAIVISFLGTFLYNVANEPPPVKKQNPFFISPNQ